MVLAICMVYAIGLLSAIGLNIVYRAQGKKQRAFWVPFVSIFIMSFSLVENIIYI